MQRQALERKGAYGLYTRVLAVMALGRCLQTATQAMTEPIANQQQQQQQQQQQPRHTILTTSSFTAAAVAFTALAATC